MRGGAAWTRALSELVRTTSRPAARERGAKNQERGLVVLLMLVASHRVGAVVGKLSVEPLVKRQDELGIGGSVGQFCAALQVLVLDRDLTGLCSPDVGQAWHLVAVDV